MCYTLDTMMPKYPQHLPPTINTMRTLHTHAGALVVPSGSRVLFPLLGLLPKKANFTTRCLFCGVSCFLPISYPRPMKPRDGYRRLRDTLITFSI